MTTTLKPELLNDALDTNGIGLNLPADAIGVVGGMVSNEFQVIRNGQTISVKPGDMLLKGDVIRTGAASQTIFLSSTQAVAMTKVALAANQQIALDTGAEIALEGELIEVSATDALNPDMLAASEETTGLFGALGAASIFGVPAAGVAAGGVAVAALAGGSGGGDSADAGNSNTGGGNGGNFPDTGNGDNGSGDGATPPSGGQFSSGGAQLDGLFANNPTGQTPPFSFADLGSQFENAVPIPGASTAAEPGGLPVDITSVIPAQLSSTVAQTVDMLPVGTISQTLPSQVTDGLDMVMTAVSPVSSAIPAPGADLVTSVLNLI